MASLLRRNDAITSKWRRFDVITTFLLRHVFSVDTKLYNYDRWVNSAWRSQDVVCNLDNKSYIRLRHYTTISKSHLISKYKVISRRPSKSFPDCISSSCSTCHILAYVCLPQLVRLCYRHMQKHDEVDACKNWSENCTLAKHVAQRLSYAFKKKG